MDYHYMNKKKKKSFKIWWLFIILIIVWIFLLKNAFWPVYLEDTIVIKSGDTFSKYIQSFSNLKQFWLKYRVKQSNSLLDISKIQEWSYIFTWKYTQNEFLSLIAEWPQMVYQKYVVLEWRSIFDIDDDLAKKWMIQAGDYISFVTDNKYVSKYKERYDFLSKAWNINTLEWFLYPDTYYLDVDWNTVDQLVYLQLDNFNSKVWNTYNSKINQFSELNWYDIVTLSSIIEKEEKSNANKPIVAGIFINRLKSNMMLGADITLCYGLYAPYSECTPNVIVKNINDSSNPYNTRAKIGLTPQPISNPSDDTISSVLNYKKTDYYYYLHDNSGNIHYGKTNAEHIANKNKYLN